MKTTICIPDGLFEAAEALRRRQGLSRSALYTRAMEEYLRRHRSDHRKETTEEKNVTAALNRVYAGQSSALDPVLARLQDLSLKDKSW